MQVKTIKLYEYDELSPEVKQELIEKNRYSITEYEYWAYYYESFLDDMQHYGLDVSLDKIYFSGFYNQGDGLSFEGSIDLLQYLKHTKQLTKYKTLVKAMREDGCNDIYIQQSGHYVHEYTMYIRHDIDLLSDAAQNQYYELKLEAELLEFIRDQARALYKRIQSEYEYITTDAAIEEQLQESGMLYRSDGRVEGGSYEE